MIAPLLTAEEVAEAFQVKPSTVMRWGREGRLKTVKVAGTVRFRREDVERMLQEAS